ncbi:hypothetical protein E2C01_070097 [Portunus trituberculatus]|uniref:Uncharacterized protein n=1 Tax=Portunus trituberculatus TaxID=210409 RepID=A0A5B7I4J0_PORTR|nr:hypothetical protein [Portunus trituberculatus]
MKHLKGVFLRPNSSEESLSGAADGDHRCLAQRRRSGRPWGIVFVLSGTGDIRDNSGLGRHGGLTQLLNRLLIATYAHSRGALVGKGQDRAGRVA